MPKKKHAPHLLIEGCLIGCRALGVEEDHPHGRIPLRVVERRAQLVPQLRGDRVVGLGPAQREPPHRPLRRHSDRVPHGADPIDVPPRPSRDLPRHGGIGQARMAG